MSERATRNRLTLTLLRLLRLARARWWLIAGLVLISNLIVVSVLDQSERIDIPYTVFKQQVEAGRPVLVMCGAGISRSSTFVLAYLLERGYSLEDAWRLLSERHPAASPLPQMWRSPSERRYR